MRVPIYFCTLVSKTILFSKKGNEKVGVAHVDKTKRQTNDNNLPINYFDIVIIIFIYDQFNLKLWNICDC